MAWVPSQFVKDVYGGNALEETRKLRTVSDLTSTFQDAKIMMETTEIIAPEVKKCSPKQFHDPTVFDGKPRFDERDEYRTTTDEMSRTTTDFVPMPFEWHGHDNHFTEAQNRYVVAALCGAYDSKK